MSDSNLIATVVGMLLPALVSVVVRSAWPSWLKGVVAVGSSAVVGTVTAWATGQLTGVASWAQAVVIVFAASAVTYRVWWQPTGIGLAIEGATEPTRPAEPVRTVKRTANGTAP